MSEEKFWARDPCSLLASPAIIPATNLTRVQKLNALTRLIIIVTVVLYALSYDWWLIFLLGSMLGVLLMYASGKNEKQEGFSITPTYPSLDFEQTSVAPLFAEEWQIRAPVYDLYENTPTPVLFEEPLTPQSYPYGQYLTRTNLLPGDEYATHMLNGSTVNAREYVNSAFTRNEIAHRTNMTRLLHKKMARRFRNSNLNDSFSPFTSY